MKQYFPGTDRRNDRSDATPTGGPESPTPESGLNQRDQRPPVTTVDMKARVKTQRVKVDRSRHKQYCRISTFTDVSDFKINLFLFSIT